MTNQLDDDATESMNEGRGLCRCLAVGVALAVAVAAALLLFSGCAMLDTAARDSAASGVVGAAFALAASALLKGKDKNKDKSNKEA